MPAMPDDLKEAGSQLWQSVVERFGDKLLASDLPALKMACKWLDRFNDRIDSSEKGVDISLGIACDKFLVLSQRFGLTPHDRKGTAGDEKPKKSERKRTSLDDLRPGKLKVHAG